MMLRSGALLVILALPAAAHGAELKRVLSGQATIASGTSSIPVNLNPSDPIDPDKSFLAFSVRVSDADPAGSQVSGTVLSATQLEFRRLGAALSTAEIRWQVVEFTSGARVVRGSQAIDAATTINVPVSPGVNRDLSFPLISVRTDGGNLSEDDFVRARLTTGTNLELTTNLVSNPGGTAEWQVVELDNVAVRHGDIRLNAAASSVPASVSQFNLQKAWLVYSYRVDPNSANTAEEHMIRGQVTSDTGLLFDRNGSGGDGADISYSLVEFVDQTRVDKGTLALGTGDLSAQSGALTLDPVRTFVAGGFQLKGGRSSYSTDDNPGTAWFTLEQAAGGVLATRAITGTSTADVGWFAVTFPAPAGPGPGPDPDPDPGPGGGTGGGGNGGGTGNVVDAPGEKGALEGWSCGGGAYGSAALALAAALLGLARRRDPMR
jgi:hypothetical protein